MIDLDNTLADRAGAVAAWAAELCAEHDLPPGTADRLVQLDADGYGDRLRPFRELRTRFDLGRSEQDLQAHYRARAEALIQPLPGAERCLEDLRRAGLAVAIVSNGNGGRQRAKIAKFGFEPLVDAICVSEELGVAKPDPAIFRAAATAAGATLDGAWVVGDSPRHDIGGGHRLGLGTVWLRRGRSWGQAGPGAGHTAVDDPDAVRPTHVIDSLDALAPLLLDR